MRKTAITDYPVHELISERWSPYSYTEREVEPHKLAAVLEAARWAASAYNEQPWRYILATRSDPEQFEKVLSCLVPPNAAWAKSVPVLMLGIVKSDYSHNGSPNGTAQHDLGAASASLTFQATSLGLHVHQMGGILPDKAREVFGIPEGYQALTALAIGYGGEPDSLPEGFKERDLSPRTRKPLGEFVFGGTWGTASAGIPPPSDGVNKGAQ